MPFLFKYACRSACQTIRLTMYFSGSCEGPVPVLRDASKIQVGFGILRAEILAGSGILFHRGKWD